MNDEMIIIDIPQSDKNDFDDIIQTTNNLKKFTYTSDSINLTKKIAYWELGMFVYRSEYTIKELSKLLRRHIGYLSFAKKIVKYYDFDKEQYLEDIRHGISMKEIRQKTMTSKNNGGILQRAIYHMRNAIDIVPWNNATYKKIQRLAKDLYLKYGALTGIIDKNYIKYSNCCCCNKEVETEEGHIVKTDLRYPILKYPVCRECYDTFKPVSWVLVALMYAVYAIAEDDKMIYD